jgi:hypothetical protein
VTILKHSGGACTLRDGCAAEGPRVTPAVQLARRLPDRAEWVRNLFALQSRKRGAAQGSGFRRPWQSVNRQRVRQSGASTTAIGKNLSLT